MSGSRAACFITQRHGVTAVAFRDSVLRTSFVATAAPLRLRHAGPGRAAYTKDVRPPMDINAERDIWDVFHDGSIASAGLERGANGWVKIEIEYLRDMFDEPGDSFYVHLEECRALLFRPVDSAETLSSERIGSLNLQILSATEDEGSPLRVFCVGGTNESPIYGDLEMVYASSNVTLDTGRHVPVSELFAACGKYWNDWGARIGQ